MTAGSVARIVAVLAACVAAVGSATSTSNSNQHEPVSGPGSSGPPPPQQMDPVLALGLWRSTFGAVKIEPDTSKGGLPEGGVHGVWVYQRQGREVVGYFTGNLRGNVLEFRWQEPNDPPLTGEGYLVFDAQGRQYAGRWWSDRRDRVGDWNGWRQPGQVGGERTTGDSAPPYSQSSGDTPRAPYRRSQPYRPSQPDPSQLDSSQPRASQPSQQAQPPPQQSPYI